MMLRSPHETHKFLAGYLLLQFYDAAKPANKFLLKQTELWELKQFYK